VFMIFELLSWWYGPGWMRAIRRIYNWATEMERTFSAGLLLKTLFSPWRRIISLSGRSLQAKFRDAIDNLISRLVGATVRSLVLLMAGGAIVAAAIFGVFVAIVWPLIPLLILYFLFKGIV
jgi:hypothetical protein